MKKSIVAILEIGILLYPVICFSSYIIHLKNGGAFTAERYYEEEGQIKFRRSGGVIGIQKDLVREIEEVEDISEGKENVANQEAPAAKVDAGKQSDGIDVEKVKPQGEAENGFEKENVSGDRPVAKEGDKEGQGIDVEYYKNQQKELIERYKEAKKKLNEAILSRNKRAVWEAKKEIKEIHEKLAELIRDLKSISNGTLPDWWHAVAKSQKPDN